MDALYFRVSSDRQTTENQFDELITAAQASDPGRDWNRIRSELGRSVIAETRTTHRGAGIGARGFQSCNFGSL
jgi:DNA invertase Pin-like site-specific DNA recombinase